MLPLNTINRMKSLYILSLLAVIMACQSSKDGSISPGAGVGGSMARFTVAGDMLYTVNNTSLQLYSIANSANPVKGNNIGLGFGVETIFPYGQNLFIGTQTGVYIFDITQPASPKKLALYQHIMSCDPVVAQGNLAFSTLRSGTACRNGGTVGANVLDVIDFTNPSAPKLLKSYPMQNPHGLGVDGNLLFVSEGDYGLKVLDITDPLNAKEIAWFKEIRTYDVIPNQKVLIVTGPDGLFQYSYANPKEITLLSKLPIE